jgi:adenine-specific DNA-methyltransferase
MEMDGKSLDITQERLNKLKEILPDAFTEESVGFDDTENIFIEGENLEVLKVLQKSYFGKIKMIYIDPPYNTGNDKFIYPDKFSESRDEYLSRIGDRDETGYMTHEGLFRTNSKDSGHYHSNWLSMMYPVAT